ncbi:MAG: ribosomal protein S18-alanine N-acetyltransferase [Lautropia sp.]
MRSVDLDAVMRIEQRIYPFPWSRGNFLDSLRAGYDGWLFIAVDGSETLLGYALAMWALDEVHLLNLSIAEAHQGRGFGGDCLRWLMRDARRRGAAALLLEVRPSNPRAIRLYQRAGLQTIGIRRGYYPYHDGAREDAIVMRGDLSAIR